VTDGQTGRRNPSGYYSTLHREQCRHAVKNGSLLCVMEVVVYSNFRLSVLVISVQFSALLTVLVAVYVTVKCGACRTE